MSTQLTRKSASARRRLSSRNTMAFPRELREAIPDLHTGRILELDSIDGHASNNIFYGRRVQLRLVVKESGKLKGKFTVLMALQPAAARTLAATLTRLADQAEHAPPRDLSIQ